MNFNATVPFDPALYTALYRHDSQDLQNLSSTVVTGWVPEPQIRGTGSLLYSCIFTIGLCIWTAIHPNIPGEGDGRCMRFYRKLELALGALLLPELILSCALNDFLAARRLRAVLKKHSHLDFANMTYCHYAIMGGIVLDAQKLLPFLGQRELRQSRQLSHRLGHEGCPQARTTLTRKAIEGLAERGCIFEVPKVSIQDKSKLDSLNRGLAVIQISWLIIQCVARLRSGLPLTLLEIHTMVHVFVAVMLHTMWWSKPKDVKCAEPIQPSDEHIKHIKDLINQYQSRGNIEDSLFASRISMTQSLHFGMIGDRCIYGSTLVVFPIAYGSVHLAASAQWGSHGYYFVSRAEALLWDSLGYTLLATGLVLLLLNFLYATKGWRSVVLDLIAIAFAGMCQTYFLVESFASLRSVPSDVYRLPDWVACIPHF